MLSNSAEWDRKSVKVRLLLFPSRMSFFTRKNAMNVKSKARVGELADIMDDMWTSVKSISQK